MSRDFGAYRELLSRPPSSEGFDALCAMLGRGPVPEPIWTYVTAHVDRWPATIARTLPIWWVDALARGERLAQAALGNAIYMNTRTHDMNLIEDEELGRLVTAPETTAIETLALPHHGISERGVAVLARSSMGERLRALNLEGNDYFQWFQGGAGVDVPGFRRLMSLNLLDVGYMHEDAYTRLANAVHLRLESLTIGAHGEKARQLVQALATGSAMERLRHLTLDHTSLSARELIMLLASLPALAVLELLWCHLEDDEIVGLSQNRGAAKLQRLDLSFNPQLSGDALQALAASPHLTGLTELALWGCEFEDEELLALVGEGLKGLTMLHLGHEPSPELERALRHRWPELTLR